MGFHRGGIRVGSPAAKLHRKVGNASRYSLFAIIQSLGANQRRCAFVCGVLGGITAIVAATVVRLITIFILKMLCSVIADIFYPFPLLFSLVSTHIFCDGQAGGVGEVIKGSVELNVPTRTGRYPMDARNLTSTAHQAMENVVMVLSKVLSIARV